MVLEDNPRSKQEYTKPPPGITILTEEQPSTKEVVRRLRELTQDLPKKQRRRIERAIKKVASK